MAAEPRDEARSRGEERRGLDLARRMRARALEAVLGSAVHRMNNLLAVSTTQLQLIELDLGKKRASSTRRRLASTRESLERSGAILALLASIATADAREREAFALAPLLADTLEILPACDSAPRHPVRVDCDAGLFVRVGRGALVSALALVFETLVRESSVGLEGSVVVAARALRGAVELSVAFEAREGQLPFAARARALDPDLVAWLGLNAIRVTRADPGPRYVLRLRTAIAPGA